VEEEKFKKLIKRDLYQVFLFSSPVTFPMNFASHPWFIVNLKGKINRWEVIKLIADPPQKKT